MAADKNVLAKLAKLNNAVSKRITASEKTGFDVFKKFPGITEYISCGNYIGNAVLSGSIYGGFPNTRSVELAGKSGTGKTFFMLNGIREAQQMGYYMYYIDTEGATDDSDFLNFGCDPDMLQTIRTCDTYLKVKFFISALTEQVRKGDLEGVKIGICVDSYGMLNTQKEKDDAGKGHGAADMGLRAKEGRQLFRTFTLELSNLGIPFWFTNHTGASLDMFKPGDIPSGGEGPTFAASIIMLMDKSPLKDGDGEAKTQSGIILRIKSHKNRLSRPHEERIHISWASGMNKYVGCEKYIGWENCGVQRGTIMTEKEFNTKFKKGTAVNSTGKELVTHWIERDDVDSENAKKTVKVKYAAVLNDAAKTYAVKDTLSNQPLCKIWTGEIWTPGTLKQLDEVVIKPMYKYSTIEEQLAAEIAEFEQIAEGNSEISLIDEINLNIEENEA